MASTYKEEDLKQVQQAAAQTAQQQTAQQQKAVDANLKGLSDTTKQNLAKYQAGYQQSDAVTAAQNYLQGLQQSKPQDYVSQYDADISNAYQQIMGRQPFKYDLNADMLYQQYKDQYQTLGKQAMIDTMGQAAGLTGGYGNSYAATVGNQAYQGYLQQLNNIIPDLYDRALNQYAMEGDALMDRYNLAKDMDAAAYGKWQDAYNRWFAERGAAEDTYNTERGFDYGMYQDALNYWNNFAQAESDTYWQGRNQAYNMAMAMIQAGKTPDPETLYNAGISDADYANLVAMYAPKKRSGGTSKKKTTTTDGRDITAEENWELNTAAWNDAINGDGSFSGTLAVAKKLIDDGVSEKDAKAYAQRQVQAYSSIPKTSKKQDEYLSAAYGW